MGCCFSNENDSEPSTRSNLLNGQQRKYVENTGTTEPRSARQHRPPTKSDSSEGDIDDLIVPTMKRLAIESMSKTFQDQERLYNEILTNYHEMVRDMDGFKSTFHKDTSGIPELPRCVRILVERCGKAPLDVERRKNCVQIVFSEKNIMTNAVADPHDVLKSIQLFNSLNKHLEKVLEHSQHIQNSINLIVHDEEAMRLRITKSSLPPAEGTETLHHFIENIKTLENMRKNIGRMKKNCEAKLKDIIESSKGFFENSN